MHINFLKRYDFYFKDLDKITFVPEEWPKGYMAYFIDKNHEKSQEQHRISTLIFVLLAFFLCLLILLSIIALATFWKRQCMPGMSH